MQYMCSKCGENFKITFLQYILGLHIIGGSKLLIYTIYMGRVNLKPLVQAGRLPKISM